MVEMLTYGGRSGIGIILMWENGRFDVRTREFQAFAHLQRPHSLTIPAV